MTRPRALSGWLGRAVRLHLWSQPNSPVYFRYSLSWKHLRYVHLQSSRLKKCVLWKPPVLVAAIPRYVRLATCDRDGFCVLYAPTVWFWLYALNSVFEVYACTLSSISDGIAIHELLRGPCYIYIWSMVRERLLLSIAGGVTSGTV